MWRSEFLLTFPETLPTLFPHSRSSGHLEPPTLTLEGSNFHASGTALHILFAPVWNAFGISLFKLLMFNLICVRVLTVLSVHHVCVPDANRGQRAFGPWELELEI